MTTPAPETVPRGTVVVACYNHERFLESALASAFGQDEPCDVIVTDDASVDGSQARIRQLLDEHGWHAELVFHDVNQGICATFNDALTRVRTPYVAFIAADDYARADRMRTQMDVLDAHPEAGVAVNPIGIVDEHDQPTRLQWVDHFPNGWPPPGALDDPFFSLLQGDWLPAPCVLSRTSCLRAVGGYDESLPVEDWDMWIRILRRWDLRVGVDPLATYRVHPAQVSEAIKVESVVSTWRMQAAVLGKHLGYRSDADDWMIPRLFIQGVQAYREGARPAEVRPFFLLHARRAGQVRPWVFWAMARLGVPGRALARPSAVLARATGLVRRGPDRGS